MRRLFALLLLLPLTALAAPTDETAALASLAQPGSVLIDVRSPAEFAEGAVPGAHNISHEQIAARIAEVAPDKDTPIVVYCRSGRRSSIAQDSLRALGYRNVSNGGGYEQFSQALNTRPLPTCSNC
jgi:phage shock protein E